jgi:tetratricopeptide (TPR) repeat protein
LARGQREAAVEEWIALVPELDEYAISSASYALRIERGYAESLRLVEAALRHRPRSAVLYVERAWNRFDQRDYSTAIRDCDMALKFEPDYNTARLWKTICLRLLGRPGEAASILNGMIEQDVFPSKDLLNERAAAWLTVDDQKIDMAALEHAARDYDRAFQLDPDDADAVIGQAQVRIRLNRSHEAIQILRDALARKPDNDSVRSELGFLYIRLYENEAAKREFEQISNKKDLERANGLAVVEFKEGQYDKAEAGFRSALELRPDHPVIQTNIAWALTLQVQEPVLGLATREAIANNRRLQQANDRLQEAEDLCARARARDPNYPGVYGCLGAIAVKRGQVEQAEAYFKRSIELSMREGSHVELAALYIEQGRLDEAEAALKNAFAANPHDVGALLERGKLQLERKESASAIRSFQHALTSDPWNEEAARALARAYEDDSRLADAEKVLRDQLKRLQNPSRQGRARLALVRVLAKIGDLTEEKRFYEEAMELVKATRDSGNDDPDARYHLAVIAFKLDDHKTALKEFKKCTDNPEALRHIAMLSPSTPTRIEAALRGRVLPYLTLVQAIAVWQAFLSGLINEYLFSSMELAFAALFAVAIMMPRLSRFKLAGLEADVGAPTESLTLTRRPEIGFSSVPRGISHTPR